jgi:hypothetical protein
MNHAVQLTYIQTATIDMGNADTSVNTRQPYVGIINMAMRYSNMPPNDQNNSITMTIVARVDVGKYSSINVELEIIANTIVKFSNMSMLLSYLTLLIILQMATHDENKF